MSQKEPNQEQTSTPYTVDAVPWHCRTPEEALQECASAPEGLSAAEAARRLLANGNNQIDGKKKTGVGVILVRQFKSVVIWILIGAGLVSALMGQRLDAIAILAIVRLNAAIGFWQEYGAEKSVSSLRKLTAPQARVQREGKTLMIQATQVVVGDILVLEAGDVVAADGRLLEAQSLRCSESALTGESKAVPKRSETLKERATALGDRANLVFVGTTVAVGTGRAVVVATAMATELGRIAELVDSADGADETPLQQRLDSFGRVLLWATLGIVTFLFGLGLWRGTDSTELLLTSISLAVAAVPEGLPTVVTVALSLGVTRMARRHALIRRLAAVETLGSTSVICTDKTGTLTLGEMTANRLAVDGRIFAVTGEGYGPTGQITHEGREVPSEQREALRELAFIQVGGTQVQTLYKDEKWAVVGDPTEGALQVAGIKAGIELATVEREWPKLLAFPFDSERKRSSTVRRFSDGRTRVLVNGAPGEVLERCSLLYTAQGCRPLSAEDRERILAETRTFAASGLRVLASAVRDLGADLPPDSSPDAIEQTLTFVGLTGMYDPPRASAKPALLACQAAGIRVVMITGDHVETAGAIAREIGLASATDLSLTGAELDAIPEPELRQRLPSIAVYARVTAAHKLRIVRALQEGGAIVAMTGDGVNDAPAIKGADIGIAMGRTGAEVTKQAADMVLTNDDFSTILAAVEEGRGVYTNIKKTLQYLLAGSTAELMLMTTCVVLGMPSPLQPIHLLWINLVTDGLPALCLAGDPIDTDVLKVGPRPKDERITNRRFILTMLLTGVLTAGVTFAVYSYMLKTSTKMEAQTAAFSVLVFAELFRAFGARHPTKPLWAMTPLWNRNLIVIVLLSLGLQWWSLSEGVLGRLLKTTPLSLAQFGALVALGAIPLIVLEIVKVVRASRPDGKAK